jgi:hypothetical protein
MAKPHSGRRTCRKCGLEKEARSFPQNMQGYRERMCTSCRQKITAANNPMAAKGRAQRRAAVVRKHRIDDRVWAILEDAARSDRKRKLVGFDLDRAFVTAALAEGCRYCGDNSIMMTLDRIDNALAHTRANVTPSCIRCNYLRRDMPHAAWLSIIPAVRAARIAGLFGDWATKPFWHRKRGVVMEQANQADCESVTDGIDTRTTP